MKAYFLVALLVSVTLRMAADLPRCTPEAQGVASSAILSFLEKADKNIDSLHSFMLLRHGHVIAEGWWSPYEAQSRHALFSLSKSFTSTAVGLAIAEGKFSLDDDVLKFFTDDAPAEPGPQLKAMRVRDLLRMNTGHETEPPRPQDQSWTKAFLAHPVRFKPGTHFLYNTSATYMLAAIVEKTTGMPLVDYLQPRLFEPLGIQHPTWDKSPQGIALGGYGLSVRTEDIARFGQLYLQLGKWEGKQLVPEAWVQAATSFQTSNGSNPRSDWDQGYGYQFWRCRHDAYRGDGAFGQYCLVMPQQDAVIAITAGLRDMQAVLNLVWDELLPAMSASPLSADPAAVARLGGVLKQLALTPQEGSATSATAPTRVRGKAYQFPANARGLERVAVDSDGNDSNTLVVQVSGIESRIPCGCKTWKKARVGWGSDKPQAIAASGAWTGGDTFIARICVTETPFVHTVRLQFGEQELRYNSSVNVAFGPTKEPEIIGTLVVK
jgi:CubicO group peptidase (beta-lactamase class C family)